MSDQLDITETNVVQRLQQRLAEAKAMGLCVRMEMLDDQQATWCEIAGVPTLFVNLSQTASEQLEQLDENLRSYTDSSSRREKAA